ncbi:MAG: acetyl-CoA carboxylase, carboxyltransferase subunit beta [Pseudomonadota bacterium]|nr:acetyl-CoA carboxylase, carboxyltransferase subunit beta [Pseudomonadota bacterium]
MSWLRSITKPGVFTRSKKDVKANVWVKCPSCGDMLYRKDLAANLNICTNCGHHHRISVQARLAYLCDEGTMQEVAVPAPKVDPLKFKDRKSYADRLKDAKKASDGEDAFKVVIGDVDGVTTVLCLLDFAFMAGSMGTYVGEAIVKAAQTAKEKNLPLVLVPASGGARMQEGILSLMQMARTTAAILDLKDAGLPYLVLLTDPTTGGVTASFAMQGDVLMAEPGALIGFAGPRVIQQTIGETLPEGFQTAEYLKDHGMVDMVTGRHQQKTEIAKIFKILTKA